MYAIISCSSIRWSLQALAQTDQTSVWTHNKQEVADRENRFNLIRRRLCAVLGIPPGPEFAERKRLAAASAKKKPAMRRAVLVLRVVGVTYPKENPWQGRVEFGDAARPFVCCRRSNG